MGNNRKIKKGGPGGVEPSAIEVNENNQGENPPK